MNQIILEGIKVESLIGYLQEEKEKVCQEQQKVKEEQQRLRQEQERVRQLVAEKEASAREGLGEDSSLLQVILVKLI